VAQNAETHTFAQEKCVKMIKLKVPGTPNRSKSKVSHPQRPHGRIRGSRPIPGPFKGLGQNTRILGVPERGHEHPQGWEQGEHHSTDPRTAENAPFFTSRGLGSGGTTERSSAKEISDLLPAPDANRASHVRGVMGWGVQNTYLKGFRRRLMACLP